jgi:hypothetical protein
MAEKGELTIGHIRIMLPDENSRSFYIFQDLTDILGKDDQGEVAALLRRKLKELGVKPMADIDHEADNCSIRSSKAETILAVARVIDGLALPEFKSHVEEGRWDSLLAELRAWKRPKPQRWGLGDIFVIPLSDSSFCFGQVVGAHPTCALFEVRSQEPAIDPAQLSSARLLTVLHVLGMSLNANRWKVIGHSEELFAREDAGPWGANDGRVGAQSGSDSFVEWVAEWHWFQRPAIENTKFIEELIIPPSGIAVPQVSDDPWLRSQMATTPSAQSENQTTPPPMRSGFLQRLIRTFRSKPSE